MENKILRIMDIYNDGKTKVDKTTEYYDNK